MSLAEIYQLSSRGLRLSLLCFPKITTLKPKPTSNMILVEVYLDSTSEIILFSPSE